MGIVFFFRVEGWIMREKNIQKEKKRKYMGNTRVQRWIIRENNIERDRRKKTHGKYAFFSLSWMDNEENRM